MLQITNMITNQINHRPLDFVFAFGSKIRRKTQMVLSFPLQIYTSVNVDYKCWLINKCKKKRVLCTENTKQQN